MNLNIHNDFHNASNKIINNSKTMFMVLSSWQSHCENSPGSFDECRTAPSGRRPKTKPDDLGYESACTGCQSLHPPSPCDLITQPESWYWFYRPTEGRRLSRPSCLVTYRHGVPAHRRSPILVLTGSDVAQLRWSRLTRYHCVLPGLIVTLIFTKPQVFQTLFDDMNDVARASPREKNCL